MAKDVQEYFKEALGSRRFFTKKEFISLLEDKLSVETDDQTNIFLDFLIIDPSDNSKASEGISLERIMQVYQKYSQRGVLYKVPSRKESHISKQVITKQHVQLPKEEQLLKDFADYIKLKRISWKALFPYQSNSNHISYSDLDSCFKIAQFNISKTEQDFVVKFLDPQGKNLIFTDILKNYIKKHQNDYFELPFQSDFPQNQQSKLS